MAVGSPWPKLRSVPCHGNAWTVASRIKRRDELRWRPGKRSAMLEASRCIGVSQQLMRGYGWNACIRQSKIESALAPLALHSGARTNGSKIRGDRGTPREETPKDVERGLPPRSGL